MTRIIFFIIIVFILNISFYYISEDYRFFIKKIKNSDDVVYLDTKDINDEIKKIEEKIEIEENKKQSPTTKPSPKNKNTIEEIPREKEPIEIKKEIILWKNYKIILDAFSKYTLEKLEMNSNLFDLTDEYPDPYYEYYSKDLTLYLFTTKSYNDVKDIINIISYDVPYKINEVNNFLDKSFYINLDEKISDNFVRLVISYKSITFWLKIKKDVYNDVKETLKQIDSTTEITEEEVK